MSALSQRGDEAVAQLSTLLQNEPSQFLQPTNVHQQSALDAAKSILDPLASRIADAQVERRNENRRKRKRGTNEVEDPVLQLRQVYTQGLAVKQVWEQARRILDAACDEIQRGIDENLTLSEDGSEIDRNGDINDGEGGGLDLDDDEDDDELLDEHEEDANSFGEDEAEDGSENEELDSEEDIEADSDIMSVVSDGSADSFAAAAATTFKVDPNNLNDGFFSIDDFNKQSQFLEQMDAQGDDDNPSDEDEVDWDADPLAQPLTKATSSQRQDTDAASEDEEGPTFGNADISGADSDSDMDDDEVDGADLENMMPGLANTNDIRYTDFFEPPPKKLSKSKRTRALPKTQPQPDTSQSLLGQDDAEEDTDLVRAMADVKRDLLDSEDEDEGMADDDDDDDSNLSDGSDTLPKLSSKHSNKNLSTHEKQQLQIAEEIRRLEALNVSKKPWTLSGEATASARPLNSLIEEDLEFERTGKPVPVVTAELSNDIEALIKRRILARDFDEVVRRAPTALNDTRRGRVELDDSKPSASLGELYEQQFTNTESDSRSKATKKAHDDILKLWTEVRDQLDVLGNLHFKPKRAEISVKTVEDKPRIAMEDARPAGADDGEDQLAPQEVYKPGTDSRAAKSEVMGKSGASTSKEEMSREEKTRRRRREKERLKKSTTKPAEKTGKQGLVKDLQKGGVKVVGKDGQLQALSAKSEKKAASHSGGNLKL